MRNFSTSVTKKFDVELTMVGGDFRERYLTLHRSMERFDRAQFFVDASVHAAAPDLVSEYTGAFSGESKVEVIECSESFKNVQLLSDALSRIDQFSPDRRREPVVIIGGGVLLDTVGLACSQYRRGIPYIRVPTSLIGQVDVSVAAKTGVNFNGKRNRLGSFHPPILALLDSKFLHTLPDCDVASGFGEIIKIAVIADRILWNRLWGAREQLNKSLFSRQEGEMVIWYSARKMLEILASNYWEDDLRRSVDFGHSFSPQIEMDLNGELTHGASVALDVLLSCQLSSGRGLLPADDVHRVRELIYRAGLPVRHRAFCDVNWVWRAFMDTISHRAGRQHLPVPTTLGEYCFIEDLTRPELEIAIKNIFPDF